MSAFLDFPNEVVSMGLSTLDVHNKWKSVLTNAGWQVKAENTAAKPYILDVIPPATEAIGNDDAYEFLRITTNDAAVSWQSLKHWNRSFPQMVRVFGNPLGAVTVAVTLAGETVSYTGTAASLGGDNMIGLFDAIKASESEAFKAYSWELSWPAPQNADDGYLYLVGTKKAYFEAQDSISGMNCTADILGIPVAAGYDQPTVYAPSPSSVAIDLTNGFIYYFQICARGLALGIRTNAGYFGAIHACYSDHAKALAAMPKNSPYCTPIELLVGWDDDSNNCDSWGRAAGYWGVSLTMSRNGDPGNYSYSWWGPGSGRRIRDTFQDMIAGEYGFRYYGIGNEIQLQGSYLFVDDSSIGNDFQIHRVGRAGYACGGSNNTNNSYLVMPPMVFDDWYKFRGTAVDENLITVADTVKVATLTADVDASGATLAVDDLSVFQPSGSVVIGAEWITYTGKSAASGAGTLTGCVKGTWSTTARKHYAGEKVSQGLWFVKMNGSALFAGYTKPEN